MPHYARHTVALATALSGVAFLSACAPGGAGRGGNAAARNDNGNENTNPDPSTDVVRIEDNGIVVEVDERSSLRVYLDTEANGLQPLTAPFAEVDPSARLVVGNVALDDFVRTAVLLEAATGALGPGQRLTVTAQSDSRPLQRTLILETADAHPGVVLTRTRYTSLDGTLEVEAFVEHEFELQAVDRPDTGPTFWSFQGGAERWGDDYVLPIEDGASRDNEQAEIGGIPYCDIWSRGGGLGVGSASTVPRYLKLPVRAADGYTWLAIEWPKRTLPEGIETEVGAALLVAHAGDVFPGARAYARAMAALAVRPPETIPEAAYLQQWETYGYVELWTVGDITWRLDELVELGIGVVTIDSGWYEDFATGDYNPDPALFPEGDADVRALTDAIHEAGLLAKLWWQPGNVERESDRAGENYDWLVLEESADEPPHAPDPAGNPNDYGDEAEEELTDYMLCPAVPEVIEFHEDFVRRAIEVWGFDGFKMDYIYAVPPCDADGHSHERPEASVEAYPEIYRAIAETARELLPEPLLNVCNCGVTQSFYVYPYQNQLITSDPIGSRQMRVRTKVLKAFFGATAPVLCDHVELSVLIDRDETPRDDETPDFASCLGSGAVLQTKYTELESDEEWDLFWKWLNLGRDLELSSGEYLGGLYTYGFDVPEAHAVRKDDVIYYGFFVEPWGAEYEGSIELRGLEPRTYRVRNYADEIDLGTVEGPSATLEVTFQDHLLLRASPLK
ncbi:MAG: hypothetical protein GY778_30170 [bacterium]|nr:hypothetical protein [bacterium]